MAKNWSTRASWLRTKSFRDALWINEPRVHSPCLFLVQYTKNSLIPHKMRGELLKNCKASIYSQPKDGTRSLGFSAQTNTVRKVFIIEDWWWGPSLRNYSLKQINNIYTYIYLIYMCVYLIAPSRGQPLCFSLCIYYQSLK